MVIEAGIQSGTMRYSKCRSGMSFAERIENRNDPTKDNIQAWARYPFFFCFKYINPANEKLARMIIGMEYATAIGVSLIWTPGIPVFIAKNEMINNVEKIIMIFFDNEIDGKFKEIFGRYCLILAEYIKARKTRIVDMK